MLRLYRSYILLAVLAVLLSLSVAVAALGSKSDRDFDPTQRMFDDFNKAFARHWKTRTGVEVTIRQAQSKQSVPLRASVDGLKVVSLALSYDQAPIQKNSNFSLPHWDKPPPQNSPFTSTIVFLVRKGNPKNLRDWDDLTREGVQVVASNPKTSDEGRWSYLAAWGYALKQPEGNGATALEFVTKLFANMKVLGRGTQNSVASFVDGGIGDVLLAWENEAHGIIEEWSNDKFEIITPSLSILAEPPVSVVSDVSDRTGAREVPRAYIDYLYTVKAQNIAAQYYYRPRDEKVAAKYAVQFPPLESFTIDEMFGGWKEARNTHFADGGVFDRIQDYLAALQ